MLDIKAKVVLTDIEGTTTSISFVKDVLFPYAKKNTKSFLQSTWTEDNTKYLVERFAALEESRGALQLDPGDQERTIENVATFVNYLIDKDLKVKPLKKLQGYVWEAGYKSGQLEGHVYDDVPEAFRRWAESGAKIAIYSSGSVKAQELLFGQSTHGDLLNYIYAHYDTEVGPKKEPQSYANIATELQVEPNEIVFLTDIIEEAEAAREAGLQTIILSRPGNAPLTDDDKSTYNVLSDFKTLNIVAA